MELEHNMQAQYCWVKTNTNDYKGYFLIGSQLPTMAPSELLDAPPMGKRYGEAIQDGIVCIQLEKNTLAKTILKVLDECECHYKALATNNVMRLFFKGDMKDAIYQGHLMCGVEVEMASTNGYLLHFDDNWEVVHSDNEYDHLPPWLYPTKDAWPLRSKTSILSENEWVEYLRPIFNSIKGYGRTQSRKAYEVTMFVAHVLNTHFRKNPFDEERMNGFLDYMEFTRPSFWGTKKDMRGNDKIEFEMDKFSEWFVERYKMINLQYLPYAYSNGVYRYMTNEELEQKIMKYLPNSKDALRKEVRKHICSLLGVYITKNSSKRDQCFDVVEKAKETLIAFNNGILDIESGELIDFDESIYVTNRIPFDYVDFSSNVASGKKTKAMEIIDNWLDSFSEYNHEKRLVLEECAGLCLFKRNQGIRRKHVFIEGPKESGKSTYISMLNQLVGKENCSFCSVEEISNLANRFTCVNMVDKILNSSNDVSRKPISDATRLKNLATSDPIYVEQKGQPMFELSFYGTMVFGCNELPIIKDEAISSRFEFIRASGNFNSQGDACIPNLFEDYLSREDCMEYFAWLAIQGLLRFIRQKYRHTYCEENELLRKRYERISNPTKAFLEAHPFETWENKSVHQVHEMYINYLVRVLCLQDSECDVTLNKLSMLLKRYGYDTKRKLVDGQRNTYYVKNVA